jgi:hypothetical protein
MTTYIYAFVSVFIVSIISLIGVFSLSLKEELIKIEKTNISVFLRDSNTL